MEALTGEVRLVRGVHAALSTQRSSRPYPRIASSKNLLRYLGNRFCPKYGQCASHRRKFLLQAASEVNTGAQKPTANSIELPYGSRNVCDF